MKSFVSLMTVLTAGALFAAAVPEKQVVTFSTQGPDRYADGSVVADGECYALVWSKDGVFEGIDAQGQAKGEGDKVVYIGAFAKDGKCPFVSFHIADGLCGSGYFDLWLLDTRVFDNGEVRQLGKKDGKVTVSHAVKAVASAVAVSAAGTASAPQTASGVAGGVAASAPTVDRASVPAPKITNFGFDRDAAGNEFIVLDVENTVPGVGYTAVSGTSPSMESAAEGKVTSGNGGTVKIVMPKAGDHGFFKGVVK